MQIMPPTGARIAKALGVEGFDVESLFQPDTNIRFGAFYLAQLLRKFDGSLVLAIAAYNAGPEVVRNWAKEKDSALTDVFVDSVPYGETRRYLRKVLRSIRMYGLLYAGIHLSSEQSQPEQGLRR